MDHDNPEIVKSPGGEPCLTAGSWSTRSFSHSLQRAENLLRSTFNPSLQWLFQSYSQDEEAEEGDFVVAHNLTFRSSARLLCLQQALLTVAPQWQLVGGAQMPSPQVCVKALPAEGGVLLQPSSSFLQGNYKALCRLLEQRSLLLFIHEYTKRARTTAAYISTLSHLLEDHLKFNQTLSSWSSYKIGLTSLSQELRVHLSHWSCLFSKAQSDHYLRPALAQQTSLLVDIRQTLDLLGLQALVLMERYVYVILSAIAQTDLDSVPREVMEDVVAGADLYNQVVSERAQHSTTQLRTVVLQQAHYSTLYSSFPNRKGRHPSAFSVKELMMTLALHHADIVSKQLQCWASEQSSHICQVHTSHKVCTCADSSGRQADRTSCGTSAMRSEWTWEQLQHDDLVCYTCHKTSPVYIPGLCLDSTVLENQAPVLAEPTFVQQVPGGSNKDQTSQCQTHISQTGPGQTGVEGFCIENHSSVELFFQLLISSSALLAPPASHTPRPEAPSITTDVLSPNVKTGTMIVTAAIINPVDSVELNGLATRLDQSCHVEGSQQDWAEQELTAGPEAAVSSGCRRGDPVKEETLRPEGTTAEQDCVRWPHSVQWSDLTQSLVFADLFGQYRTLLRTLCRKALWMQLHVPHRRNTTGSINLQDRHMGFQILHRISQASNTDLVPKECRTMLEDFSLYLRAIAAHAQWDQVVCRSLGSALKDKCVTDVNGSRHSLKQLSEQDGRVMTSETMEHFLLLSPPLLSALCCHASNSGVSGSVSLFPSMLSLQLQTVSLALASVQLSTVWVMSKAYQFLTSWSLNKFLLIVQGDLKVLRQPLEVMVHQTRSLMLKSDSDHHSTLHSHNQLLLRQQLKALDQAVSNLQTFSSVVLKRFSNDCKRMSGEIFQQTMPPAVHWRPSFRTGFPRRPSEYASLAAQTVIGQVLEGVAPLSDDARVQTLCITMTAFMEAWMEHILKQRIKFSVQGALQLKQDFDSIRELIQSDKYGLSAELHQRLLSLRVFQQVDSAVVCLLQQPQAKSYLQSRSWEPFTQCCPVNLSSDSIDTVVGSSITNLRCMDGEDLIADLPPLDPSLPGEPYLAPSLALGAAQQEWLDLRVHSNIRRWRLPGLQCLSKSEH